MDTYSRWRIINLILLCGCIFSGICIADTENKTADLAQGFNISPISGDTEGIAAIGITLENSSAIRSGTISMQDLLINLTDSKGTFQDVILCSSVDPKVKIQQGDQFYLIKRNKPVFFIVDDLNRTGCGGGGGSGSQQGSNKDINPKGVWKIQISNVSDNKEYGSWKFTV